MAVSRLYHCSDTAATGASFIIFYVFFSTLNHCTAVYSAIPRQSIDDNEDDKIFDWLNENGEDEDDENEDLLPVQADDGVFTSKMNEFFEKLNWLRQKHSESRRKSTNHELSRLEHYPQKYKSSQGNDAVPDMSAPRLSSKFKDDNQKGNLQNMWRNLSVQT